MGSNTGWRKLAPERNEHVVERIEKSELYQAARDAAAALNLATSTRALLNQLVGFFKETIDGRALVWPSNAVLIDRTGLSERQVRYSIRQLIEARVLNAKDSANGKRFAVRSAAGQIIDAFGLDLTPLLARWQEFQIALEEKRSQRAADKRLREEVTITRRTITEALSDPLCSSGFNEMTKARMEELRPHPARVTIEAWRILKHEVLSVIYNDAGSGGSDCRHKETDNDASDQSCNKSPEQKDKNFDLGELLVAVPAALTYVSMPVRSPGDLVEAASTLRGAIGAHRSAWDEACAGLGNLRAAAAVFIVAEIYDRDVSSGSGRIRNAGGYFRAFVRMMIEGRINLALEIRKLRGVRP